MQWPTHLDHAAELAARTGEHNTAWQHFGPTNVALWRVAVDTDLGGGAAVYERALRDAPDLDVLGSVDRSANFHFDLARALVSCEGDRDAAAIRHLDTADRLAPQRIRPDPIVRELVGVLDRRSRRRVWEPASATGSVSGDPAAGHRARRRRCGRRRPAALRPLTSCADHLHCAPPDDLRT